MAPRLCSFPALSGRDHGDIFKDSAGLLIGSPGWISRQQYIHPGSGNDKTCDPNDFVHPHGNRAHTRGNQGRHARSGIFPSQLVRKKKLSFGDRQHGAPADHGRLQMETIGRQVSGRESNQFYVSIFHFGAHGNVVSRNHYLNARRLIAASSRFQGAIDSETYCAPKTRATKPIIRSRVRFMPYS